MDSDHIYHYSNFCNGGIHFTAMRETVHYDHPHKHDFLEFVYMLKGKETHYIDGHPYPLVKGDLLIIDTNQIHHFESNLDDEILFVNMILLPEFVSKQYHSDQSILDMFAYLLYNRETGDSGKNRYSPVIHFQGNDLLQVDSVVNTICDELEQKKRNYEDMVLSYVNILLLYMIRSIDESNRSSILRDIRTIMPGIIHLLESKCDSNITLGEIADSYFYSPSYFSRAFKHHFGVSFSTYMKNLRIKKAINLLNDSNLSIEKISEMVGYKDKSELYRTFRNFVGVSPGEFRKNKTQKQ